MGYVEDNQAFYARLAAGDPDTLAAGRIPASIAKLAAQARAERSARLPAAAKPAAALPALAASTTRVTHALPIHSPLRNTPVPAHPSVQPASLSRAAQAADVHLGPINASRKRCGLALLSAGELTREFADLDRLPAPTKAKVSRRDAGNAIAARQRSPVDASGHRRDVGGFRGEAKGLGGAPLMNKFCRRGSSRRIGKPDAQAGPPAARAAVRARRRLDSARRAFFSKRNPT